MRKGTATNLETRLVPIVGEAPAGRLMPAEENILGQVQMPKEFLQPQSAKFFLLRVRGDSINRAKIEGQTIGDGDLVLVRQQERADPENHRRTRGRRGDNKKVSQRLRLLRSAA